MAEIFVRILVIWKTIHSLIFLNAGRPHDANAALRCTATMVHEALTPLAKLKGKNTGAGKTSMFSLACAVSAKTVAKQAKSAYRLNLFPHSLCNALYGCPMPHITIEKIDDLYKGWSKCYLLHIKDGKGNRRTYQAEDHGNCVAVLPYDPQRRTALVIHQLRPPLALAGFEERIYEVPAGIVEEDVETCARREAFEEAGVVLSDLEPIGTFWAMPGLSTERVALFLAPYSATDLKGAGGGLADEHEDIIVKEVSLKELARMADAMEITDMKSYLAVQTLRQRHADLF